MLSRAEQVACEDVVMFVNAAITSTAQQEFRSSAAAQRMSLDFLHEYVLGNYRDLYAATLALQINDHNAASIVVNLLRTRAGTDAERKREGQLIARALRTMPPQRAYGVFVRLRKLGVNNRRTRAIIRDWVAGRPDLAFDAVKYRRSLGRSARHAHLQLPGEVGTALFDWRRPARYSTPILESWRRAHYDTSAVYDLPYTVAEGIAAGHGIKRAMFLERIAPRMTTTERVRLQATAEREQVASVATDLARMPLTRLARYVLSLPIDERERRGAELTAALRRAARPVAGHAAGTWGHVTAVLDDSYSAAGTEQNPNRPLAVALAANFLLEALATTFDGLWLAHRGDPLLVRPIGRTGLGERILDGLQRRPDRLVIVSDGWENDPAGLAAEVLRVWSARLDPAGATSVVHLNPVYDSETFDVRRLGPDVATVGVRDAEDIAALVELARFGAGTTGLAELRQHFEDRVDRFLGVPDTGSGTALGTAP